MRLKELAKEIEGAKLIGGDAEIKSLCTDSRVAGAGDLFLCFRGTHHDSHAFAPDAEERGVAAVLTERELELCCPQLVVPDARLAMARVSAAFYGHPEKKMKIIGVTGTNGKTTISHMLFSILEGAKVPAGLIGTLGAKYAKTTVAPDLTTPDPISLFSLLADMAKAGVKVVVMEVSAHALVLQKTEPITYEIGIFTNLTQDHLDFFGDMKRYGAAKKLMFAGGKCREAVLNADDAFTRELLPLVPYTTYGLETPADCFALVESENLHGTHLMLNLEDELIEVELSMTGRHNVYNALAAATAARKLGISDAQIAHGLAVTRVDGRLEQVCSYHKAEVFVDFAHTPDGLVKSLQSLRPHCERRLILLFGCGGNRDRAKRPLMGKAAAEYADFTVITSDNPRYEDPVAIISEIEAGFRTLSDSCVCIEEREEATRYALGMLEEGDVLLVAGKGGEREQEIMGIKYSYNDKAVIKSFTEKK